jgi:hypothetical protein
MAKTIKSKRTRTVKVEQDTGTRATAHGGAVLADKLLRRLGVLGALRRHLPERSPDAAYPAAESSYALIAALILGGRGISAAEMLREDAAAAAAAGVEGCVPEEASMHRVLTEVAGLEPRAREDAYEPVGVWQPRMDIGGDVRPGPKLRRVRTGRVEAACEDTLKSLGALLASMARSCFKKLKLRDATVLGFVPVFGDASDIEVRGECFDAAARGRDGQKHMRLFTLMVGPILAALDLRPGNTDEGNHLPRMIRAAGATVKQLGLKGMRRLGLFDSAYFENGVVRALNKVRWRFIIGANQMREILSRIVSEQPRTQWTDTGEDARRGWIESGVCAFTHLPGGWDAPVTIVARRRREAGDLPGVWRYAFVGTNLEASDLPAAAVKQYGYAQLIWMLYGTKQGRENHYKQLLDEIGLHHPPSGRLGLNQVFYTLGAVASNLAMVLRYRVLGQAPPPCRAEDGQPIDTDDAAPAMRKSKAPARDFGMTLRRVREKYFQVAAVVKRSGRTLTVRLMTAGHTAERRLAWMSAWHAASSL